MAIPKAKGQALADEYGIKFFETSAKTNLNVEEVFFSIAKDIKQRLSDTDSRAEPSTIKIGQTDQAAGAGQATQKILKKSFVRSQIDSISEVDSMAKLLKLKSRYCLLLSLLHHLLKAFSLLENHREPDPLMTPRSS
ncbi:hypothetical protein F2Q69_00044227 [Brassica cretica]|uniref:Uncharacterized protein n=1 Tax=Brassica cretica TaxID=69181 RepID=A0A8S9NGL0_BRACR|nr:hypothetical protein F2Q69_00044227 [Brassica cretica]